MLFLYICTAMKKPIPLIDAIWPSYCSNKGEVVLLWGIPLLWVSASRHECPPRGS